MKIQISFDSESPKDVHIHEAVSEAMQEALNAWDDSLDADEGEEEEEETPPEPIARKRGIYLSLLSAGIGRNIVFNNSPEMQHHNNMLLNPDAMEYIYDFIRRNEITRVSLYDLWKIIPHHPEKLTLTMLKLREAGITQLEAVCGDLTGFRLVEKFVSTESLESLARFDSVLTEFEYWNSGIDKYQEFIELLKAMKNSPISARFGGVVKVNAYLGGVGRVPGLPISNEVEQISQYIDTAYIHCYTPDPYSTFAYGQKRFELFTQNGVKVIPIFSEEGTQYSAGPEYFLGEWYKEQEMKDPHSGLRVMENFFKSQSIAAGMRMPLDSQHYSAFFVDMYQQAAKREVAGI